MDFDLTLQDIDIIQSFMDDFDHRLIELKYQSLWLSIKLNWEEKNLHNRSLDIKTFIEQTFLFDEIIRRYDSLRPYYESYIPTLIKLPWTIRHLEEKIVNVNNDQISELKKQYRITHDEIMRLQGHEYQNQKDRVMEELDSSFLDSWFRSLNNYSSISFSIRMELEEAKIVRDSEFDSLRSEIISRSEESLFDYGKRREVESGEKWVEPEEVEYHNPGTPILLDTYEDDVNLLDPHREKIEESERILSFYKMTQNNLFEKVDLLIDFIIDHHQISPEDWAIIESNKTELEGDRAVMRNYVMVNKDKLYPKEYPEILSFLEKETDQRMNELMSYYYSAELSTTDLVEDEYPLLRFPLDEEEWRVESSPSTLPPSSSSSSSSSMRRGGRGRYLWTSPTFREMREERRRQTELGQRERRNSLIRGLRSFSRSPSSTI